MSLSASSHSADSMSAGAPSVAAGSAVRRRGPLLCLALAGVLWGAGGLAGTLLGKVSGLSPLGVATVRLLAGGVLLVAFRLAARQLARLVRSRSSTGRAPGGTGGRPPGRQPPRARAAWTRIAIAGLLGSGFQAAYFLSISLSSVSLATLITIGGTPVIVHVAELVTGRQRPERSSLITLAVALAGLGLLIGLPGGGQSRAALLASAGFALLSAAGFAALTLIGASPVPGLDDLAMTGYGSLLGGLALLPLALIFGGSVLGGTAVGGLAFRASAESFGLIAGLGIGPTALAYILYYRGLRSASPTTAALMSLLEPLTAAILGAAILGDRLSLAGITGAILLGASVLRTVWASR
jgi:drug/metabolite transporter, DME family